MGRQGLGHPPGTAEHSENGITSFQSASVLVETVGEVNLEEK